MNDETNIDALAARDGSPEAFEKLYERVAPALAAWARLKTSGVAGTSFDADDLSQEIWWRAVESFERFDVERAGFRAWIFGIAANTYRQLARRAPANRIRGRQGDSRLVDLDSQLEAQLTSITRHAGRSDRVAELVRIVEGLEADDRRLFVHCGLEGAFLKDVGPMLGITEGAAKKRWQRLRETLLDHRVIREFMESA